MSTTDHIQRQEEEDELQAKRIESLESCEVEPDLEALDNPIFRMWPTFAQRYKQQNGGRLRRRFQLSQDPLRFPCRSDESIHPGPGLHQES